MILLQFSLGCLLLCLFMIMCVFHGFLYLGTEIVNGFLSNAVSKLVKWAWSLKATTKTGRSTYPISFTLSILFGFYFWVLKFHSSFLFSLNGYVIWYNVVHLSYGLRSGLWPSNDEV